MWSKRHTFGWIKIIHHECVLYLFSVWLSEGQVREVGSKKKSPKLIVYLVWEYWDLLLNHILNQALRLLIIKQVHLGLDHVIQVNCRPKVIFCVEKFSYNISQFTLFNCCSRLKKKIWDRPAKCHLFAKPAQFSYNSLQSTIK